jgi:hypothetical protein
MSQRPGHCRRYCVRDGADCCTAVALGKHATVAVCGTVFCGVCAHVGDHAGSSRRWVRLVLPRLGRVCSRRVRHSGVRVYS